MKMEYLPSCRSRADPGYLCIDTWPLGQAPNTVSMRLRDISSCEKDRLRGWQIVERPGGITVDSIDKWDRMTDDLGSERQKYVIRKGQANPMIIAAQDSTFRVPSAKHVRKY
jgi:hypothetical protein